jgi:hypothetical protein
MKDGRWKMEDGRWKMEDGGRKMLDRSPWGVNGLPLELCILHDHPPISAK